MLVSPKQIACAELTNRKGLRMFSVSSRCGFPLPPGRGLQLPPAGLLHRAADQRHVQGDGGVQLGQLCGHHQPLPGL